MTRKNISFPRRSRGFTLIETVIAIIIGLLVLAAAAGMISNALSKNDMSSDAEGMTALIANAKTLRSGGTYGTSGTNLIPTLIAMKAVPATIAVSGTTLSNNWGGAITMISNGSGYTTTSVGIPQGACIEHAIKLSKAMYTTAINGGTAVQGQVTQAAATAGCNDETNNTIVWTTQS